MKKRFTTTMLALLLAIVANAATAVTLPTGVQPKDYTLRAVFSVKNETSGEYEDTSKEIVAKIAISGSDIYVAGLSYFYPEAYVKGTLATDGTATFPSGQYMGADIFNEVYVSSFTLSNDEVVTCDFKLHYNAEADILAYDRADLIFIGETGVPNGTEGDLLAYIKGATYTPRSSDTTEKTKVDVPEDLVTEPYLFTSTYIYYEVDDNNQAQTVQEPWQAPVKVGLHGDDLYIQGLAGNVPDGWCKATKNQSGQYVVPAGQYLGDYDVLGWGAYVYPHFMAAIDRSYKLIDVVLNYDPADGTITSNQTIVMNRKEKVYDPYSFYRTVTLKKVVEREATPANPEFTFHSSSSSTGASQYYTADIFVPLLDTEGLPMLADKLAYQFYCTKDGQDLPVVFPAAKYRNLKEDISELPYGFTDGFDFSSYTIYFESLGVDELKTWKRLGLQSIYRGLGKEHRSDIVWFDLTKFWDPSGIETIAQQPTDATCTYYDLQGRPVASDARGLVLRRSVNADGTVTVRKFLNRKHK
jgi:hypothetical protein